MDTGKEIPLVPAVSFKDLEKMAEQSSINLDEFFDAGRLLVEWLHSQPHLPAAKENFLRYCGFFSRVFFRKKKSMERAKEFIDAYYTLKNLAPEYLLSRDPANQQMRASLEHFHFAPMPTLTESMTRVYVGKILDKEFAPHMLTNWHKYAMMTAEIQQWDEACLGEEIVVDFDNLTLEHVSHVTPSFLKKLAICYLKAFIFKPYSVHYLNVPVYAEIPFNFVKTLIKPKIANRLFIYKKGDYEALHERISPKHLPKDFGGEGPALEDVHNAWLEKMSSYREWFLEQDNYVVKEELRPGKHISHSDVFGMEGSFRQLTVD